MKPVIRTAPAGSRLGYRASAEHLAKIDALLARGAELASGSGSFAVGGYPIRRPAMAAEGDAQPPPDQPNTPPDTGARLDAHDAQLADHAARIAALENKFGGDNPDDGTVNVPAEAHASVARSVMINSAALYAGMHGRTAAAPMPKAIGSGFGQMLDGAAITARHNAVAAARAGRRG